MTKIEFLSGRAFTVADAPNKYVFHCYDEEQSENFKGIGFLTEIDDKYTPLRHITVKGINNIAATVIINEQYKALLFNHLQTI